MTFTLTDMAVGARWAGLSILENSCSPGNFTHTTLSRVHAEVFINFTWSSDLPLPNFDDSVSTVSSDCYSWMTEVEPDVVLCCNSPFASRVDMLYVLTCFSADHCCKEWSQTIWGILLWSLSPTRHFHLQNYSSWIVWWFLHHFPMFDVNIKRLQTCICIFVCIVLQPHHWLMSMNEKMYIRYY